MHPLDHIMLAAPDLEAAVADFEQRTGVRPSEGGRHPGQGSRNVLATLGNGCYLEIIGPDLAQDRTNNFGEVLSRLRAPTLLKFAVGTGDIAAVHQRVSKLGLWPLASSGARADGPFAMSSCAAKRRSTEMAFVVARLRRLRRMRAVFYPMG